MASLEQYIFDTIPAEHDYEKLNDLIQAARLARKNQDQDAYRDAVVGLLNFHLDSHAATDRYTPYNYQSDGFIDNKNMAIINAKFRNKVRSGNTPKTMNSALDSEVEEYREAMPRISYLKGLAGWDIVGAVDLGRTLKQENYNSLVNDFGLSHSEADYISSREALKTLRTRRTDQSQSFIRLNDSTYGNSISIHMVVDGSGKLQPKADENQVRAAIRMLENLRKGGLYKGKVNVHLLDDKSAKPKGISGVDDDTIGYTFNGADAIYLYVDRVSDQASVAPQNPGYWSTDFNDANSATAHIGSHEVGHQIGHSIYGRNAENGIKDDYKKFQELYPEGKPYQSVSIRGSESFEEDFAERFARYAITGEAPEWFVELLRSQGISKATINTKWRQAISKIQETMLPIVDVFLKENELGYPEQDNSKYGNRTDLGSATAHRLARYHSLDSNTPEIVDTFTPGWTKIYRGISSGVSPSGRRMTSSDYHREFAMSGKSYYSAGGGTFYGDGTYSSTDRSTTRSYGDTKTMAVNPNARIFVTSGDGGYSPRSSRIIPNLDLSNQPSWVQLEKELKNLLGKIVINEIDPEIVEGSREYDRAVQRLWDSLPLTSPSHSSLSNLALFLGYDAVEVSFAKESFFLILNRGIVQVKKSEI